MIIRYEALRAVINSVYEPIYEIYITFFLLIIFIYIMTLFSFFVIPYEEKRRDVNGEIITIEYCQYLLLCVLYTFDHTFKDNGGVGGWLTEMKRGEW